MREFISTLLALVVIVLSGGDLAIGVITWLAVWFVLTPRRRCTPSAHRRYRMRETERRNESIERDNFNSMFR